MKRYPLYPATDRALARFRLCSPPITPEERGIADGFDVEAELKRARESGLVSSPDDATAK